MQLFIAMFPIFTIIYTVVQKWSFYNGLFTHDADKTKLWPQQNEAFYGSKRLQWRESDILQNLVKRRIAHDNLKRRTYVNVNGVFKYTCTLLRSSLCRFVCNISVASRIFYFSLFFSCVFLEHKMTFVFLLLQLFPYIVFSWSTPFRDVSNPHNIARYLYCYLNASTAAHKVFLRDADSARGYTVFHLIGFCFWWTWRLSLDTACSVRYHCMDAMRLKTAFRCAVLPGPRRLLSYFSLQNCFSCWMRPSQDHDSYRQPARERQVEPFTRAPCTLREFTFSWHLSISCFRCTNQTAHFTDGAWIIFKQLAKMYMWQFTSQPTVRPIHFCVFLLNRYVYFTA